MKKLLLLAAFVSLFAASCQKNNLPESPEPVWDGPTGQIHLQIGSPDTKVALSTMKEHQINQVQIFVFNSDGALETDRTATNNTPGSGNFSLTLTSRIGPKTVYALVNAPRIKPATLSELEGSLSDLKDNTKDNLVMSGKKSVTVSEYNGTPTSVNIYVKKLAAAVLLANVTADFSNTALEGSSFVLKDVYLKNVVGRALYGVASEGTGTASTGIPLPLSTDQRRQASYWYNKFKLDTAPLALTYDACNLTSVSTPNRILYGYPNTTTFDPETVPGASAGDFTPRHTRLVLHAQVGGKDTYYPFDLPVLEPNKKYSVSVHITMLGKPNDNDDTRVTVGSLKPVIVVSDWDATQDLPYNM